MYVVNIPAICFAVIHRLPMIWLRSQLSQPMKPQADPSSRSVRYHQVYDMPNTMLCLVQQIW